MQKKQNLGKKAASLSSPPTIGNLLPREPLKFRGYIVEYKNAPLSKYKGQLQQSGKTSTQISTDLNNYKTTLVQEHTSAVKDIAARLGKTILTPEREYITAFNGIFLNISGAEADKVKASPYVKGVFPNYQVKTQLNDSTKQINADDVWTMRDSLGRNITGEGITVAVLDTGADSTHSNLGQTPKVEPKLQQMVGPNPLTHLLYVAKDRLIYSIDHKIYLYSFSGGIQEIDISSPVPLWARKAAYENGILAYYAVDQDGNAALYFYNFNTGVQKKIADTQGIGTITISNGNIFYGRLREARIDSPGPYFYFFDTGLLAEFPLGQSVFLDSFESIMSQVSGTQIVSSYKPRGSNCPSKIVITDFNSGASRDIVPPETGFVLSFKNNKLLYVGCDKTKSLQDWNIYYLYDINSGESTRLSYNESSSFGLSGMGVASQYLENRYMDTFVSPKADFYAEFEYGSYGYIGNGIVYFTQDYLRSNIIAYDLAQHRYALINPFKLPFAIRAFENKVCFTADDKSLYCHIYDPNYQYVLPNFFNSKVIAGFDFVENDNFPLDNYGHGTHVSAIAGGNGALRGVALGSKLVVYKVMNRYGIGLFSDVIAALDKAVQARLDNNPGNDIQIINMSLGCFCSAGYNLTCGPDDPVSRTVDNTVGAGIIVVVAAGNSGKALSAVNSPGTSRKAITVGSVNKSNILSDFSSHGPVVWGEETIIKPDVVAPGENICAAEWSYWLSERRCLDSNHISLSGTSMATPHVAGLVALIKQRFPDLSPTKIKEAIMANARNLGYDVNSQGKGLVDAQKTILQLISSSFTPTPTRIPPTLTPKPTVTLTPMPPTVCNPSKPACKPGYTCQCSARGPDGGTGGCYCTKI